MAIYQIGEFGSIKSMRDYDFSDVTDNELLLPEKSFNNVWNFILENQAIDKTIEKAFSLSQKRGNRIIQTKNYVGVIETKSKDVIEILPKIWKNDNETFGINESKRIFLKMLSTLKDSPFQNLQSASLEIKEDYPLLEVFILNYIIEVEKVILYGLKRNYAEVENNSNFLKGSLVFNKHLLRNITNQSKFYCRYNNYEIDIPQNRIIVSTLNKLFKISVKSKNRENISRILNLLTEVKASTNIQSDVLKVYNNERLFKDYIKILKWSEVFLLNKGFTNFSGTEVNQALLFPMETMFENFVSTLIKKYSKNYNVTSQHFKYYLVDNHLDLGKFKLRPDIYLEAINKENNCIILDLKWKSIDENKISKNYLINQSDMYQLFAYGKKYWKDALEPKLILIYPKTNIFTKELEDFHYEFTENTPHLTLKAFPFDLSKDYEIQVRKILGEI